MFKRSTVLKEKIKESLSSVLPIAGIVLLLCFTFVPVPGDLLLLFLIGTAMITVGMGLFTLGTDTAMSSIGKHIGVAITKTRNIFFIVIATFVLGVIITISEPDLQVLAEQAPGIPNLAIILAVAIGVGFFLVMSILRILLRVKLSYILIFFYALTFALLFFVPESFIAVAFDSGGVTTGPMTVPFIMALGVGISSIRSDKNAEADSFGLVALCSVGPIIAVLILGIAYGDSNAGSSGVIIPAIETSTDIRNVIIFGLPKYIKEVSLALLPVVAFFGLFQIFSIKLSRKKLAKISVGLIYTYFGLVLFLSGANLGFMPVGNYLGQMLGESSFNFIVVPIGMIVGYFIVAAEPAVHVLNKQVFEITSGAIPKKALSISLSIGVSISVGLAMLRIVLGIPIIWYLAIGYAIAIIMSFFVPPIFTAIAFDSGGVASGPMTATFLLPFAMGVCSAVGGNVATDAFGVVAMVAMTPLISIQILGIMYKIKMSKNNAGSAEAYEKEIISDGQSNAVTEDIIG